MRMHYVRLVCAMMAVRGKPTVSNVRANMAENVLGISSCCACRNRTIAQAMMTLAASWKVSQTGCSNHTLSVNGGQHVEVHKHRDAIRPANQLPLAIAIEFTLEMWPYDITHARNPYLCDDPR